MKLAVLLLTLALAGGAWAQAGGAALEPALRQQVEAAVRQQLVLPAQARAELTVGGLDARLKLAPCRQTEAFVPAGTRLWGSARAGLRCLDGPVRWRVFVPVSVQVFGPALVSASAWPNGSELDGAQLSLAEVELSAGGRTFADPQQVHGRVLARPLAAGEAVRAEHLRARQWFAAGDTVSIRAAGPGFAVASEGLALNPGLEGQPVRVRTDSGRIVIGLPVGARKVEVSL